MLPMEEFDAPEAVRADFETADGLRARRAGASPASTRPRLETTEHSAGERLRAVLQVPEAATYFDDHFPRRPVFPGTLLMDNLSTLALQLAGDLPALHGSRLAVARVRDVKIRAFIAPGQTLELEAHVQSASADGAQMKLAARADGRTIATARIEIERSHAMTDSRRRVAITGIGMVTPAGNDVATTWEALLAGRSGGRADPRLRRQRLLDADRGRGQGLRRRARDRRPQAAQVRQSRRTGSRWPRPRRRCATPASGPTPRAAERWGCVVGTGMMGVTFDELAAVHAVRRRQRRARARRLARPRLAASDPMAFCRSQSNAGWRC